MDARPHSAITPELLLNAYAQGFFPMANEHGEIGFFTYEPRGIIPLDDRFSVRRSLRHVLKKNEFNVTVDTAPREVLRACSRMDINIPNEERWLSDEMIELYLTLFEMGRMHTVEVWEKDEGEGMTDEKEADSIARPHISFFPEPSSFIPHPSSFPRLLGGLYGLTFGAAFCGESMFSRAPYASQIALVHLVEHLRCKGFQLLDAQMPSEHLAQFGMYECSREDYLTLFHNAAAREAGW